MDPDTSVPGPVVPPRRQGYWALLRRNPSFRRLYFAQAISFAGDWFSTVPLLGLVLELTDSALMVSLVLTAQRLASFLLAPLGGVVADRFNRKHVMIASDLVRVAAAAGLVFVDDLESTGLAIGLVIVLGIGLSFSFPASRSALPNLVDRDDLPQATVLYSSVWGVMSAIGAALGGTAAVSLGRDASFLVDAGSFGVSAILVLGIRGSFEGRREARTGGIMGAFGEGLQYARRSKPILSLLTAKTGFAFLSGGLVTLYPVLADTVFDAGDFGTGMLYAVQGLGALVGPVVVERLFRGDDIGLLALIGYGMVVWSVATALIALAPTLILVAVAVGIGRMGGGVNWTFAQHGYQRLSEDAVRGRVFSLDFAATTLAISVSIMLWGLAIDVFSMDAVVVVAAVITGVFAVFWQIATRPIWRALAAGPSPS